MSEITALYADENGEIFDAPGLSAMGRMGLENVPLAAEDLIPLPEGADLMFLPERPALGISPEGEVLPMTGRAVAALLPAGYTRLFLPAFEPAEEAERLPLYGYTAVALYKDELYAAAIYTERNSRAIALWSRWEDAPWNGIAARRRISFIVDGKQESHLLLYAMPIVLAAFPCSRQNAAHLPRAALRSGQLRKRWRRSASIIFPLPRRES